MYSTFSRQEGWRLEPSKLNEPTSDLMVKGVVFNEMKGVFVSSDLFQIDFLTILFIAYVILIFSDQLSDFRLPLVEVDALQRIQAI